jgi:hypothetical protein
MCPTQERVTLLALGGGANSASFPESSHRLAARVRAARFRLNDGTYPFNWSATRLAATADHARKVLELTQAARPPPRQARQL